ncbi:lamin tail domain-containing protein [Marinobacteraceae bacterium S3BR75-40.1]
MQRKNAAVKQTAQGKGSFLSAVVLTAIISPVTTAAPILTEVLADPASGLAGDANGDGIRSSSQDEFVEILNDGDTVLDLSGALLSDSVKVRHEFSAGTILQPYQAIVVFGGGDPDLSASRALIQTASSGRLSLNNGGDEILLSGGGFGTLRWAFGDEWADNRSLTLSANGEYVAHTDLASTAFSPGTTPEGNAYSAKAQSVPEPATLGLLGMSLLMAAGFRRRDS